MNFPIAPEQASTFAVDVDNIFIVLCLLTLFFTVLVPSIMMFLAIRYRRGSRYSRKGAVDEHLFLELSWSIGPLFLALGVFLWAAKPFTEVYRPPADATEIFVIGKRWMWHVQHANGIRENNELHIPVGKPIKLTMISQDVIHGFFVPAFRVKRDVLPGRYNTCWFLPTRPGKYHLFCSEYCGTNHSEMTGWVYVMDPADYQVWTDTGGTRDTQTHETITTQGESLYNTLGCANCHAAQNNVHGPTLYGIYNKVRQFTNGSTAIADDNYLRTSIINPTAQVVKGYSSWGMPAYPVGPQQGQLTEEQVLSLVAYIKTLGVATTTSPTTTNAPTTPNTITNNTAPKPTDTGSPEKPNGVAPVQPADEPAVQPSRAAIPAAAATSTSGAPSGAPSAPQRSANQP